MQEVASRTGQGVAAGTPTPRARPAALAGHTPQVALHPPVALERPAAPRALDATRPTPSSRSGRGAGTSRSGWCASLAVAERPARRRPRRRDRERGEQRVDGLGDSPRRWCPARCPPVRRHDAVDDRLEGPHLAGGGGTGRSAPRGHGDGNPQPEAPAPANSATPATAAPRIAARRVISTSWVTGCVTRSALPGYGHGEQAACSLAVAGRSAHLGAVSLGSRGPATGSLGGNRLEIRRPTTTTRLPHSTSPGRQLLRGAAATERWRAADTPPGPRLRRKG